MKLITFTVPCYNSEGYMRRCIDSLLVCGEEAEIIIVNDGSTDGTGQVADEYSARYPDIVRVIHKENGGHGSGVNAGIQNAKGLYFKVVDSDDWLDKDCLFIVMEHLRKWAAMPHPTDLLICNYVYDHLNEGIQRSMGYQNVFPEDRVHTWNDIGWFKPSQYLLMHALIFRTQVLWDSGVKLPEHTFYVDNIFAYQPLPFVKSLCYLNLDLYHYFLGRDDQSVTEENFKKRIDQQIRVTKLVAEAADLRQVAQVYPKLARYMRQNISMMVSISSIYLLLINTEEALAKRKALWAYMKELDQRLYLQLRYIKFSGLTYLPGKMGRLVTVGGYRFARKIYKFN